MARPSAAVRVVACAALCSLLLVAGPTASADAPAPPPAVAAATAWLKALSTGSAGAVTAATRLPLSYQSTSKTKRCERRASSRKEVDALLSCLATKDKLFFKELKRAVHIGQMRLVVIDRGEAPRPLAALLEPAANGATLVHADINGDGVTFELLFEVSADAGGRLGVSALVVDTSFAEG